MPKEFELWQFIHERLIGGVNVMLLVVVESSGSSPGRAGYKMAVAADGELCGSIGGGVMEIELVERAKAKSKKAKGKNAAEIIEQVHRKDVPNASGMICSGRQTVIRKQLTPTDIATVEIIIKAYLENGEYLLLIGDSSFSAGPDFCGTRKLETDRYSPISFRRDDEGFTYSEDLNRGEYLYIIGGGHCALALSEIAAKLGFRISIFDDRPDLNTLQKNRFANEITIIDSYEDIASHVISGDDRYVVVMTLGFMSDAIVIRQLIDRDFKYFGVLGSKAKMATLIKELRSEGIDEDRLANIRTPIGLPINSRTPEEIAISIAAEMIAVKNE